MSFENGSTTPRHPESAGRGESIDSDRLTYTKDAWLKSGIENVTDQEAELLALAEIRSDGLQPEDVRKIMAKVRDIDAAGTAFNVISPEKSGHLETYWKKAQVDLANIMRKGIVPTFQKGGNFEEARKTRKAGFSFNVIGWENRYRAPALDPENKGDARVIAENTRLENLGFRKISNAGWFRPGRIAILFDVSAFKERQPGAEYYKELHPAMTRSFRVPEGGTWGRRLYSELPFEDDIYLSEDEKQKIRGHHPDVRPGKPTAQRGFGFQGFHRVSPRLFNGVVIWPFIGFDPGGSYKHQQFKENPICTDPTDIKRQVMHIVSTQLNVFMEAKEKYYRNPKFATKYLLPIYDVKGNLLWPKQMTYEEVKQFSNDKNLDT